MCIYPIDCERASYQSRQSRQGMGMQSNARDFALNDAERSWAKTLHGESHVYFVILHGYQHLIDGYYTIPWSGSNIGFQTFVRKLTHE